MKQFKKIIFLALTILAFGRDGKAQGTISLDYRNGVVSGNTWTFDLFASAAADYIAPDQNDWQAMNVRMDIALPAGCTITSGTGTGNPTYTTGVVAVQTNVPGTPPAGSQEMGLTLSRSGQTDLTSTPVRLGTFTITFSCTVNASDVSTPRTAISNSGSFWTNLSSNPALGTRRAFGQPSTFTLPVKFSSFTGSVSKCVAQLKWSTETEVNTSYYIVEVSSDGVTFKEAGRLPARNSLTGASYSFNYSGSTGKSIYRIRVVDRDGSGALSGIAGLSLTPDCHRSISVSPNPASNVINIEGMTGKNTISIYDGAGKQITNVVSTSALQTINVSRYAKGSYIVKVVNDDGTVTNSKFIRD